MTVTGLRKTVQLAAIAALLIFGSLIALLFGFSYERVIKSEHCDKGVVLARGIANLSADTILAAGRQTHLIKKHLSTYLDADPDMKFLYLLGPDRQVIAHTFADGFPISLQGVNPLRQGEKVAIAPYDAGELRLLDVGVAMKHRELGSLHVGMLAAHSEIGPYFYLWLAGLTGFSGLALFLFLSRFFAQRYEQPLAALYKAIAGRKAAEADSGLLAEAAIGDFAPLADAILTMREDHRELDDCCRNLEERHIFLRHMIESIPYPFHVVDVGSRQILLANQAFAGTADWHGMNCRQVMGEEVWPGHVCPLEEVVRTGRPVMLELASGEGAERQFFEIHGYPVLDEKGRVAQMIEYRIDVTARKKLELSLIQNREELSRAKDESDAARNEVQDALYRVSFLMQQVIDARDFSVRYDNPNLGSCSEIMGCQTTWCDCHGKDRIRCWQVAGTYCGGEIKGSFAQKYRDCMKCSVFLAATREPVDHIGEHFNNMMHLLETKNKELEKAYAELQAVQASMVEREQMAAIGMLAAGVAHEVSGPLGRISGNLCSLVKAPSGGGPVDFPATADPCGETAGTKPLADGNGMGRFDQVVLESFEDIALIKQVVKSLESFVQGIGTANDERQVDLSACLAEILGIVLHEVKKKAVVEKSFVSLPTVYCSPSRLNQVFINILTNAVQAIGDRADGWIGIRTWHDDSNVYASISDNGPGVRPEARKTIFQPFTARRWGMGGVGLGVASEIVKCYGGDISLVSEEGKGAVFTVRLPIRHPA